MVDPSGGHGTGVAVGIVSTHRGWNSESEAWARYHLSLGFTRLYVFADDGRCDRMPSTRGVTLIPCTQAYWASRPSKHGYGEYLRDIERDRDTAQWGTPERVMQRQILNVCTALDLARGEGVEWLLHIDDDEYFWCPGISVDEHFSGLDRAGIGYALYWNHEAVLLDETSSACKSRRTWFKKAPHALTEAQRDALPTLLPGKPYFTSYMCGKSAARVVAGTAPRSVHGFCVGNPMLGHCQSKIPGVLHQPYSSVSQFCEKHLSQGTFPIDSVLGNPWEPPGVYADAQLLTRDNDVDGLRSLCARYVALSESERTGLEAGGFLLMPEAQLPIDDD